MQDLNLKFQKLYKFTLLALKANRSHPDVRRDWKWIIYIVLAHGTFSLTFYFLMYSTIFYEIKDRNFTQVCANGVLALIFTVITLKYIVMVAYQKTLKELTIKMDKDYKNAQSFSKQDQAIIVKYALKAKLVAKWWSIFTLITASLFILKSVLPIAYSIIGDEFKLVHAYDITYPNFIEEKKNELHNYLIIYTLFVYYDVYATIMYIGFVPLVPIFVLHACGQIEVVTARLLVLFDSDYTERIIQGNIKDIIKNIQEIQCFVENIRSTMVLFNELLLKAAVILIPVTAYQILKSTQKGDFRIEFFSVFIGTVAESAMPCVLGDVLLDSSEKLRLAVYGCGWETHPHAGTRGLIKMLLMQTSRPVSLNTLFRVISRDFLTEIYQHAYAIFNLMNAMWN